MYGQLEYITASMLSKYVPRGEPGPRVIQLNGGTKELYYYPKSTVQVTVVGERINKSLMEQAGMQAAVPTLARTQSPANLGFQADGSVDAIASLGAIAPMSDIQRAAFIQEALRVLKPGCPLIFIEPVPGGSPLRVFGGASRNLGLSVLQGLQAKTDAWQMVQWDIGLEGQDPHAVGIAVKSEVYKAPLAPRPSKGQDEPTRKKEKPALPKKGFTKAAGKAEDA